MKILITVMLASLLIACGNKDNYRIEEANAKVTAMSCLNDRKLIPNDSAEWKRITKKCEALDVDFAKKYGYHPGD